MEEIVRSFFLVLASEMGDKTQLLALVLALRFKKPIPIMLGILVATLANHGLAAWAGGAIAMLLPDGVLKWILALTFFLFALWLLIPDKDDSSVNDSRFGAFLTTTVTFFLAEMGDKTQLATVALGAHYQNVALVTVGTTLGMMVADGLAVVFGEAVTNKIPMKYVRWFAALLFVIFGVGVLLGI